MQSLKIFKTFLAAVTILLLGFMIQSCGDCQDVTCENGGECQDGTCQCPTGYTGTNCELGTCALPLEEICYVNSTCETDATTGEALCVCLPGWEGDTCGVRICSRLAGTYTSPGEVCINEAGVTNTYPAYNPSITCASSSDNRFIIEGFGGFDTPSLNIACIIQSSTTFIIDDTTFVGNPTTKSITHTSTGTISASNKLNIDYRVTFTNNTYEDCDMEMTKE